jgi:hypothetical protein
LATIKPKLMNLHFESLISWQQSNQTS